MLLMIAQAQVGGDYFSPIKIGVMLVMMLPWLYVAPWVHRDSKLVRAPEGVWGASFLAVGAVSMLFWMLIPIYAIGLILFIVVITATMGAYILYRNSRAEEEDKLLTANFFAVLRGQAKSRRVDVVHNITIYDSRRTAVRVPGDDNTEAEKLTYNKVQKFLSDVLYHRASEVDLSPDGRQVRIRIVVDGVVSELEPMEIADADSVIQFLKSAGGMDTEDLRRPQRGNVSLDSTGQRTDIVLTAAGTTGGQRMQLSVVQEVVQTTLDKLGIGPHTLEKLHGVKDMSSGLIIVAARPKNGVTSTLYSLLRAQDAFMKQLVTLESKRKVDLENITQQEYGPPEKLASSLTTLARRDPDVIMIDNCPNEEVAELILKIAENKLILLGMKAGDSFTALAKWVKLCGNSKKAAAPLKGILCQLLLRKLCPQCREHYVPDPQMIAKANLSGRNTDNFYRKPIRPQVDEKGHPIICPTCQNCGYFGRTGVFEYVEVTENIASLIATTDSIREIKSACRKAGMRTLQEAALDKVIESVTSIKEVVRVTQESKKSKR